MDQSPIVGGIIVTEFPDFEEPTVTLKTPVKSPPAIPSEITRPLNRPVVSHPPKLMSDLKKTELDDTRLWQELKLIDSALESHIKKAALRRSQRAKTTNHARTMVERTSKRFNISKGEVKDITLDTLKIISKQRNGKLFSGSFVKPVPKYANEPQRYSKTLNNTLKAERNDFCYLAETLNEAAVIPVKSISLQRRNCKKEFETTKVINKIVNEKYKNVSREVETIFRCLRHKLSEDKDECETSTSRSYFIKGFSEHYM